MKKLLPILFLTLSTFMVYADEKEVYISATTTPPTKPRSVVQKPSVSINDQTFDLSVAFTSDENFTLNVYDQRGTCIFQEMLISDGVKHLYQLPILEFGEYNVCIEGEKSSFEGTFNL